MSKFEQRIERARRVADYLDGRGETMKARDIRELCHSAAICRATASSIHKELEETRRAAGMPTWDPK